MPYPTEIESHHSQTEVQRQEVFKLLETTSMLLSIDEDYGSIAHQLENPIFLATNGLSLTRDGIPNSKEMTRFGELVIPAYLNKIWTGLSDPNFVNFFKTWTEKKISTSNESDCLTVLKTVARFSYLYNAPNKNLVRHEFSDTHPLFALFDITKSAQDMISLSSNTSIHTELSETSQVIHTRIHSYLLTNGLSTSERPQSLKQISNQLKAWLDAEIANGNKNTKVLAEYTSNFLMASGYTSTEVKSLLSELYDLKFLPSNLVKEITEYSTGINLIEGNEDDHRRIQETVANNLKTNPFIDAAEIDYAKIIPEKTDIVRIFAVTGTLVFHNGQAMLIRKVLRFSDSHQENNSRKESDQNVFNMVLVLPNLVPGIGKEGKQKDFVGSGSAEQRIGLLLAHLSDVDRNKVFVSTSLQPNASESLRGRDRVRHAINLLSTKIDTDFQSVTPRRLSNYKLEVVRFTGADELSWENGTVSTDQHPRYSQFAERGLVVARHEHVGLCLNNAEVIVHRIGCDLIVLDDSFSTIGSTDAMAKYINSGDLSSFHPGAHPLIKSGWSEQQIEFRRSNPEDISTLRVSSVTKICKDTTALLEQQIN